MPRFFQVNQDYRDQHEFKNCYLCAPDQEKIATHRILREMKIGDLIFNQYSKEGLIFGLSKVISVGTHKGDANDRITDSSESWLVYNGRHLSLDHMSEKKRSEQLEKEQRYIEVHTKILWDKPLGPNFFPGREIYAWEIQPLFAQQRLEEFGLTPQGTLPATAKVIRRKAGA